MIPQIDLRRQHEALRAELLDAAARVLAGSRFILGPEVQALEAELAQCCGATHGVGVKLASLMAEEHGYGVEVMRRIKKTLDPRGIMNPGKMAL